MRDSTPCKYNFFLIRHSLLELNFLR